jgi:uncharacterized protein YutE (UPF0331/DUF86 family)
MIAKQGWLPRRLAETMTAIVGFRNILVLGYQTVDLRIMRDVVDNRLDDLLAFVDAIRIRLDSV